MANKPNGHALAMAEAFQGMIHDTVKPMVDGLCSDVQGHLAELHGRMYGFSSKRRTRTCRPNCRSIRK